MQYKAGSCDPICMDTVRRTLVRVKNYPLCWLCPSPYSAYSVGLNVISFLVGTTFVLFRCHPCCLISVVEMDCDVYVFSEMIFCFLCFRRTSPGRGITVRQHFPTLEGEADPLSRRKVWVSHF